MSTRRSVTQAARDRAISLAGRAARRLEHYGVILPPPARPRHIPKHGFVVLPSRGEVLFWLLSAGEIQRDDFISSHDKNRRLIPPDETYPTHRGISMFEHPQ